MASPSPTGIDQAASLSPNPPNFVSADTFGPISHGSDDFDNFDDYKFSDASDHDDNFDDFEFSDASDHDDDVEVSVSSIEERGKSDTDADFLNRIATISSNYIESAQNIPWDFETERNLSLDPFEFRLLLASIQSPLFFHLIHNAFLPESIWARLNLGLNWPDLPPFEPEPSLKFCRYQFIAIGFISSNSSYTELFKKFVEMSLADFERPIYDNELNIYRSFLSFAIENSEVCPDKIKIIISHSSPYILNKVNSFGVSPLDVALKRNDLGLVKALVESGADMNMITGTCQKTPFMRAFIAKNIPIVEYLLRTGLVNPNIITNAGLDIFTISAIFFNIDQLKNILNYFQISPNILFQILYNNYKRRKPHIFKNLVISVVSMNIHRLNSVVCSMIKVLIRCNDLEMITFMHAINIPITRIFTSGFKLIHYAALFGQIKIVRFFLEIGEDVNVLTPNGSSAFKIAFLSNHTELVAELIRNGSSLDTECIQLALSTNNLSIIEALKDTYSYLF